jgi:hypothetical protein
MSIINKQQQFRNSARLLSARICEGRNRLHREAQIQTDAVYGHIVPGAVSGSTEYSDWQEGQVSLIQVDSGVHSDNMYTLDMWTSANHYTLQREAHMGLSDRQERAVHKLHDMEHSTRDKALKGSYRANRKAILEKAYDGEEARELDLLIAEQEAELDDGEENWNRLLRKTQASRSYEMVEWFKERAPKASVHQLIKWSKGVNKRRIDPTFQEDRISYCHWVASKIVLEWWLAKKSYGELKAKAAENYATRRAEWDEHGLQKRYDAHLHSNLDMSNEADMDASFMGKTGIAASRMEEFIDIARDKDEDLIKGFLLFREKEGLQLPQGTEAKNFANILIALSRCNGNKTAAAKLLGVARSTYFGWVKQAQKRLEEMDTPVGYSCSQCYH